MMRSNKEDLDEFEKRWPSDLVREIIDNRRRGFRCSEDIVGKICVTLEQFSVMWIRYGPNLQFLGFDVTME